MADVIAPLSFRSRDMLDVLNITKPVKRAVLDTFFTRTETHSTDTIDLDTYTDRRELARFTQPSLEAEVVDRIGFTTSAFKAPYIKEKMVYSGSQFLNRGPGENNYSGMSPQDRARAAMGVDLVRLRDRIRRREEWMAVTQLTTGKFTAIGNGINATITVGDSTWQSNHLVTPGTAWTAGGGVPLDDIQSLRRKLVQDSGKNPNTLIFSNGAWSKFINNAQVKAMVNLFNYNIGNLTGANAEAGDGTIYHGNMMGFDCYEYTNWYLDDSSYPSVGSEVDVMTANTVIMGTRGARATKHYAVIQDIEDSSGGYVTAEVPYWPKSWTEQDPAVRWMMVQSAPLPIAEEIQAFGCLTVS